MMASRCAASFRLSAPNIVSISVPFGIMYASMAYSTISSLSLPSSSSALATASSAATR
jgi:hypothetical protein